jgi:hypothetical protein
MSQSASHASFNEVNREEPTMGHIERGMGGNAITPKTAGLNPDDRKCDGIYGSSVGESFLLEIFLSVLRCCLSLGLDMNSWQRRARCDASGGVAAAIPRHRHDTCDGTQIITCQHQSDSREAPLQCPPPATLTAPVTLGNEKPRQLFHRRKQ